MKMIVVFSIRDRLKYIGHLDLMRAMQRALRRSGLPVRYSQGFNPHLQISFAAPLSVGMEGLREVMEVADRVLVLEYGSVLAEGTPSEVQSNRRVIDAYLGGQVQYAVD